MPVIEFTNVSKSFSRSTGRVLLRNCLANWLGTSPEQQRPERFYALQNVSFRVEQEEGVAVIGSNGAGKSTLLSLVAGIAKPTSGTIRVRGRIAALLELGSGFHHDLTGAENVRLNAALLGLTRKQVTALFDAIVDFSGIEDFINEPLRTYSSGMVMRLAFSVAINIDPEIMLVDEVLAVGDQAFQAKCFDRIHELRRRGKTLLCTSHSPEMVQQLCDTAIWLEHGELVAEGPVAKILDLYRGRTHAAVF